MENKNKASDKAASAISLAINAIVIALLYGTIRIVKNWKSIGYDYSEATMIVFIFGLICFGFSVIFFHQTGCSIRKKEKITVWEIALTGIPIGVGIFSYLLSYWKFGHIIFIYGLITFLIIVSASYLIGKNENRTDLIDKKNQNQTQ